ncbi:hypothetical protein KIN20_002711 [Parelaphostrongylus tenuis]|uniref:DUF7774 domain-containing protein n=1 Tax=Parelaphostrongylus tenuis TaxID=148309 RepID=A0AAD5LVM9_PARTN|nr:hypothetical protein KIN20_002711 [Parelaphostrongylus tenuis]
MNLRRRKSERNTQIKTLKTTEDDVEEFECVNARVRPAHTKLSKAKLKRSIGDEEPTESTPSIETKGTAISIETAVAGETPTPGHDTAKSPATVIKELTCLVKTQHKATAKEDDGKIIVKIVNKALDSAVYSLLKRSKELRMTEDSEMQRFLLDTEKAKQALFCEMMENPQFLPRDWGGDRVARPFEKPQSDDIPKNAVDEEENTTITKAAKAIVTRFYSITTFPWKNGMRNY